MLFCFQKLSQKNALIIADNWKYDGEYAFYDMTADPEDYEEFVDEKLRNENDHFEAIMEGDLVGFFCVVRDNSEMEIGLGLRPDLCGKGIGKDFVHQIVKYIETHYTYTKLIMKVASFNQRAIKVYRQCGFKVCGNTEQHSNGGIYSFTVMEKCE